MVDTRVTLCGRELKNPIIPASGTYGFGYEFAELYDLNCLGAMVLKGTTVDPRFGNPTPRIAETPGGLLNAVGLQNPGVEAVIAQELPRLRAVYGGTVIANVSGFSVEEYVRCCERFEAAEDVDMIELNVSCPNVHGGGMAFGTDPTAVEKVTRAVRDVTKKPLIIKLSPNVTDICDMARAAESGGADAVSLINTLLGMRIDLARRRPLLANRTGGLSGPAVLPIAVRMVYQVYGAVHIPILGLGGVSRPEDVIELMLAGAAAVQVGSANLVDPWACAKLVEGLPAVMEKYGIKALKDCIGGAHEWEKM